MIQAVAGLALASALVTGVQSVPSSPPDHADRAPGAVEHSRVWAGARIDTPGGGPHTVQAWVNSGALRCDAGPSQPTDPAVSLAGTSTSPNGPSTLVLELSSGCRANGTGFWTLNARAVAHGEPIASRTVPVKTGKTFLLTIRSSRSGSRIIARNAARVPLLILNTDRVAVSDARIGTIGSEVRRPVARSVVVATLWGLRLDGASIEHGTGTPVWQVDARDEPMALCHGVGDASVSVYYVGEGEPELSKSR